MNMDGTNGLACLTFINKTEEEGVHVPRPAAEVRSTVCLTGFRVIALEHSDAGGAVICERQ